MSLTQVHQIIRIKQLGPVVEKSEGRRKGEMLEIEGLKPLIDISNKINKLIFVNGV